MRGVSFGGYHFENNGWALVPPSDFRDVTINARYIGRGQFAPVFVGVDRSSRVIPFVLVLTNSGGASYETRYRQLERDCLRQDLGTERALVVEFDTGLQTTIQARFRGKQVRNGQLAYNVLFEASESAFASDGTAATITGPESAGGTVTLPITTSGTARTRPVIIATPLVRKTLDVSSFTFTVTEQDGYQLIESPYTYTFDHEALVDASESTAGGTDVLVEVDGTEVPRVLTGADTATATITFPLTIDADGTAEVTVRYKPTGQVYGLGATFKTAKVYIVENQISSALSGLPYRVTFDHAAEVSASRSEADGDDIRVFINGIEVDRAVVDANTSTTDVWFPVDLAGDEALIVELRLGGADFSGSTFTHGSLSFSISSNTERYHTTPGFNNSVDTGIPAIIRTKLLQVNPSDPITNKYSATTDTTDASQPSLRAELPLASVQVGGGMLFELYEGGMRIVNVKTTIERRTEDGFTRVTIADSPDRSAWTERHGFPSSSGAKSTIAYATYAMSSSAIAVVLGLDRADNNYPGINIEQEVEFSGTGASEFGYTINSDDVPTTTAYTAPTASTAAEGWITELNSTITDELDHELIITGLRVIEGRSVKIDASKRRIVLLDSNGDEIPGTAGPARATLRVNSPDHDWLACEPNTTSEIVWVEDSVEADGLKLDGSAVDRWH